MSLEFQLSTGCQRRAGLEWDVVMQVGQDTTGDFESREIMKHVHIDLEGRKTKQQQQQTNKNTKKKTLLEV